MMTDDERVQAAAEAIRHAGASKAWRARVAQQAIEASGYPVDLACALDTLRYIEEVAGRLDRQYEDFADQWQDAEGALRTEVARLRDENETLGVNLRRTFDDLEATRDALRAMLDQPHSGAHTAACPTCINARVVLADHDRETHAPQDVTER